MRAFGRGELAEQAHLLSTHAFCQSIADLAFAKLDRLAPRETITTLAWSETRRVIGKPDGTKTGWSRETSPCAVPIMADLDNPEVAEIVVMKPSRCGGTMIAENHALKRLDEGQGDVIWYLGGPGEVGSYGDRILRPMIADHASLAARLPREGGKGNSATLKRFGSQTFELLVMSGKTTTNREAAFIVFDEPDSYNRNYCSNFLEQGRQRQRMLGNDRKIYACAHPDIGWSGGIAAAWVVSSQGIFVMPCAECGHWASPYPTKYWPEVPRFRLWYERSAEGTPIDRRLALAERTAGMVCPHCGSVLDEAQRRQMAMLAAQGALHKGQALDPKSGIVGEPDPNMTHGYAWHVLAAPDVPMAKLARELEGAVEHRERTGRTDKIKEVLVRTFGEIFEGAGDLTGLDARALKERTRELESDGGGAQAVSYRMGEVPRGVRFLTLAIDVGGGKFDILVRGWDGERRSWLIDRRTIRQRLSADGVWRDIAPGKVQDDWGVLGAEIDRLYPMQDAPGMALPVAVTTIDASDGNVTWSAYEFARRMDRKIWRGHKGPWRKVRCIKGATLATAEPLPPSPTKISRDSEGKPVLPVVTLHVLGVHRLKEDVVADLAIEDHAPGQCYFAANTPDRAYDELFNEVLIDGRWVRNGPNETLDLYGYTEAGRLMLQPDRADRKWSQAEMPPGKIWTTECLPPWARPVPLFSEGGDSAAVSQGNAGGGPKKDQTKSLMQRFDGLNRGAR